MMNAILDTTNIILVLASAGAFLTILAFGIPMLARDPFTSRLKAVAKRREELQAANRARVGPQSSRIRQQQGRTYMRVVVDRLKLLNPADSEQIKDSLAQAGLRGQGPMITYAFLRFVAPLGVMLLTALYIFLVAKVDLETPPKILIVIGSGAVGFFLPQILLKNRIQGRQQALTKVFPDALDLLVICVEAGLSMDAAFTRVSEEIAESGPELAEELGLTSAELAFLPDRRQALENLTRRTGLPSVKALVTALAQSEKYGTPLSVSLRVLAGENRDERMSKAEKKAGALPAQLTVPMIAFFLPVLFVVVLGPAIIQSMATLG